MLINALKNHIAGHTPWGYVKLANCLTLEQIEEVEQATFTKNKYELDGTRSGNKKGINKNDSYREYITVSNYHKYPNLYNFIKEMQSKECVDLIKTILEDKRDYSSSYVRLEILKDYPGFWLEPHCDIPEKLISGLIYINTNNNENINIGTDLYTINKKYFKTLPFINNTGYIFNGPDKWHGLIKKNIKKVRMGLQFNYVDFTTDWKIHNE